MDAAPTTEKEAEAAGTDGQPLSQDKRRSPPRGAHEANTKSRRSGGIFRPFTPESLQRINQRIEEETRAKELAKKQQEEEDAAAGADGKQGGEGAKKEEEEPEPNAMFEAGKRLPDRLGTFPPSLYGKPIEDLDDFYDDKYTFMIVSRDKSIFRFSSSKALYLLSPFNPIRRVAMYILTHPFFGLSIMVAILVNCFIMGYGTEPPHSEEVFTAIYTCEGIVKILARGFILNGFHYLRDAWNWLDFVVVGLSYATMTGKLGKVSALRTFRVLRALKTVAVVPGLKTIVGALLEAVRRLRDVAILSAFVLSIFALIGLQLYPGTFKRKCVLEVPDHMINASAEVKQPFYDNTENWYHVDPRDFNKSRLCDDEDDKAEACPSGYVCRRAGDNPNYGYTNFDNIGWAMLCAFRLMTQDFWENLYQLTIKTNGEVHALFFALNIFMGSFYLVNVILAIVAMAYDDCRKQEALEADEEEQMNEDARRMADECDDDDDDYDDDHSPSAGSAASLELYQSVRGMIADGHVRDKDQISMKSDCATGLRRRLSILNAQAQKASLSLPGSPFAPHRMARRRSSQFSWRRSCASPKPPGGRGGGPGGGPADSSSWRPMVMPCLDNLELPYADDSAAVTPTSEDLCNFYNTHYIIGADSFGRHRLSSGSSVTRMSQLQSRFTGGRPHQQETYIVSPYQNQLSSLAAAAAAAETPISPGYAAVRPTTVLQLPTRPVEPTHFHWNTSSRRKRPVNQQPSDGTTSDYKPRLNCTDSAMNVLDWDSSNKHNKYMADNPFLVRTPSTAVVDMQDVLVIKDLIKHASGKKKGWFGYEKGMNKKEFLKEKLLQLMFAWECHPFWYKIAHIIELFIMDAFVDLFITLCIVVNTIFMALDHAEMNDTLSETLKYGNYVFTTIFTIEAGLKILALGLYKYLEERWNCFDIVIVLLSLVELGLDGVKGLSILRSFRLLRVFKLAKSWPTLNLLISIIGRTMGALGNLCFVLLIIIFIFAIMGKELFREKYVEHFGLETLPRWNFQDFLHAFMIVFRVLCGEWIESMWDCIAAVGYICLPFFLLTMTIGNLVVLNLFLALLLSSFGAESLKHSEEEEGPNKLQEAVDRINRFCIYVKSHISYCIKVKIRHKALPADYYFYSDDQDFNFTNTCTAVPLQEQEGTGNVVVTIAPIGNGRVRELAESIPEEPDGRSSLQHCNKPTESDHGQTYDGVNCTPSIKSEPSTVKMSKTSSHNSCLKHSSSAGSHSELLTFSRDSLGSPKSYYSSGASDYYSRDDDAASSGVGDKPPDVPEINEVNVVFVKYPDECCPKSCSSKCPSLLTIFDDTLIGRVFWKMRCYTYVLVEHNYFETFIIAMIITSSLALAVEDVHIEERPVLKLCLHYADRSFTIIFVLEMVVKMMAYGFKKYYTDAWCWLDFVIVVISLVSWSAEGMGAANIGAFRALRTLRALRPLRAVSRWEGMKVVVNALIQAIPSIFNVLLVCLVFWLIFSIMGVNLFSGKYGRCVDVLGDTLSHTVVNNRSECWALADSHNYSWVVPDISFDNVLTGYLALLQIATFKGWMDIMYDAIDSRNVQEQPDKENRAYFYMYFVLFIVFGSFFTLNLFIGVIIEQFNVQKKKAGGSLEMLMTEDQKKYYNAMKKLGSKQPTKPIPKPKFRVQLLFYNLSRNQKFDIFIMIFIMLNMITMAIEFEGMSAAYEKGLEYVNMTFLTIFTLECIIKVLGLRLYYFKEPWNVFDFVVVVISLLMKLLKEQLKALPSPTLLRVVRVFRVGRVLRLVKSAKGIRTLLFSLFVSMPALFNIGLLLVLVMFIYAIFGMSFFMHVKKAYGIDEVFNFETFTHSMIVLFQTCTSAGWDGVLAGLMNDSPPGCNPAPTPVSQNGDCGNAGLAIVYLVTFLVMTFLVVINMYIAVILENFSQATEDVQQGLTQDDFDMYYETWEKFDEAATQYIPLSSLTEFVDALEEPLRLPAPNLYKLVSLNIPICENDRVHCVDILDALTKNFLGTVGDTTGELGDIKKGPDRIDYNPVTTTLERQREMFVARLIQRTWRNFVKRRHARALMALADDSSAEDVSVAGSHVSLRSSAARPGGGPEFEPPRPTSSIGSSHTGHHHHHHPHHHEHEQEHEHKHEHHHQHQHHHDIDDDDGDCVQ